MLIVGVVALAAAAFATVAILVLAGKSGSTISVSEASTKLAHLCDPKSSVTVNRGPVAAVQDEAPNGTTAALSCNVNLNIVSVFVFDNRTDATRGISSISSQSNEMVVGANWVVGVLEPGIANYPMGTAQRIQGAFGGTLQSGTNKSNLTLPSTPNAVVSPTTTAITPTSSPIIPGVESCLDTPGAVQIRPTEGGFYCARGGTALRSIIWTSWTLTSAAGTGTFNQDRCNPICATGGYNSYQVAISLTDPGEYLGYLVFQHITVTPLNGGASLEDMSGQMGTGWGMDNP